MAKQGYPETGDLKVTGPSEADRPVAGNDQMIVKHDIETARGVRDLVCEVAIGSRRRWATGGMIMDEQQRRRLQVQAAFQDFAWPSVNGRYSSNAYHVVRDQLVARIEEQNPKPLDRVIGHLRPQIIEHKLIAGKYGPLHEWPLQHLCHRTPEAEEGLFDLDRAVQQFDPGRRTR